MGGQPGADMVLKLRSVVLRRLGAPRTPPVHAHGSHRGTPTTARLATAGWFIRLSSISPGTDPIPPRSDDVILAAAEPQVAIGVLGSQVPG